MSDKRKTLVRQFSLQTDSPPSRPILKKQLSTELIDQFKNLKDKNIDRPRLIKIAWGENQERTKKIPDTVEVKKCVEYRRPTTAKLRTQKSIDRDSILYSRQDLAEKLRKAWMERQEKQNINIFLHHEKESDQENEETPKENEEKIENEFTYIPSNTSQKTRDISVNLSLIIPQNPENIETEKEKVQEIERKVPKLTKQNSVNKENECKEKIKPSSATTRREMFQKRSNTAFNGSFNLDKKPTLVRQLSVPTKEPKPFAVKRRLKNRNKKEQIDSDSDISDDTKVKKKERCKSAPGGDIVTMVSLVSPAGSDVEEIVEKKPEPKKERSILHHDNGNEPVKTVTLRNTVKKGW